MERQGKPCVWGHLGQHLKEEKEQSMWISSLEQARRQEYAWNIPELSGSQNGQSNGRRLAMR
jgi:hypothetical protein